MRSLAKRLYRWLVLLVWEPQAAPKILATPKGSPEDVEEAGRWYFRRDLLDRMGEYFAVIGRMKNTDRDGYDLFTQVGAVILSPKTMSDVQEMSAFWRLDDGVGFGAVVHLGTARSRNETDGDTIPAALIYFQKMARPMRYHTLQPFPGAVYRVVAFHADTEDVRKYDGSTEFHLSVVGDRVTVLKEKIEGRWGYPPHYVFWAEDRGSDKAVFGADLFKMITYQYENASQGIRVGVKKGRIAAMFCVDTLRTPYFFSDRDPVIAGGIKKKIFHIVRTHERHTRWGRTFVKSHFRGLRKFDWNGYSVNLTMPGFHHADLLEAKFAGHDYHPKSERCRAMMGMKQSGARLAQGLDR